jgi:catechol 2,3-dioxygenase-like lactoylglutathione lyase family enzyme
MTAFKTHIALRVADLQQSIAFYQVMFGVIPVKYKPGYAKFDIDNPGLNLTLTVSDVRASQGGLSHLGIQVDSAEAVRDAIARFQAAGLEVTEEFQTDCCYALQDKAWVTDPDGHRWEIFTVYIEDTAPALTIDTDFDQSTSSRSRTGCVPACCA